VIDGVFDAVSDPLVVRFAPSCGDTLEVSIGMEGFD